jgi:cytochrome c biogenesis protein CcdA
MATVFCKNCGKSIEAMAVICVHCGVATGVGIENSESKKEGILSIIAMILGGLGLFAPILAVAGIVLAVIAKNKSESKWTYGLAISISGTVLGLLIWV